MRVWVGSSAKIMILFCFMFGAQLAQGAKNSALFVQRKEDELLLPPFLQVLEGGALNVNFDQRKVDQREKRSVKAGEWLEFGDSFAMPDHLTVQVLMNEHLQWVGSAQMHGQIQDGPWNTSKTAYEMILNRGWMKVWIKPGPFSDTLGIRTPHTGLSAKEATFWLMIGRDRTELYVMTGKVRIADQDCEAGSYCLMQKADPGQLRVSQNWLLPKLEADMRKRYPNLVRLSQRASEEWNDGKTAKNYAELRKKGWRKVDRFFPDQSSKK